MDQVVAPEAVLFMLSVIILFIALTYHFTPNLHVCGGCGKSLSTKANRVWHQLEGKKVLFCSRCDDKGL